MSFLKRFLKSLLIGSLAGLCIVLITRFTFQDLLDRLEDVTYNMRSHWEFGENTFNTDKTYDDNYGIHLIDIDDRSMQKLGNYATWNRSIHAEMLQSLSKHYPAAVLFDIFFSNAEDQLQRDRLNLLLEYSKTLDSSVTLSDQLRLSILSTIDYDSKLVDATKKAGFVFHGMCLTEEKDYRGFALSQIEHKGTMAWHDSLHPESALILSPEKRKKVIERKAYLDGIFPSLAQSARAIGHINIAPSEDGIIRDSRLIYGFGDHTPSYLPISLRAAITLFATPNEEVVFEPEKYIDIGKPFKAFKDSSGIIRFSYPNVTSSQIKGILSKAQEITSLPIGKKIDISSFMSVEKGPDECISITMNMPGVIPCELAEELLHADFKKILSLKEQETYEITSDILARRDSETDWVVTAPFDIEEWWFTQNEIQTLSMCSLDDIKTMKAGEHKLLFHNFSVKNSNGHLTSSIPCLRDKTIRELLLTGWERIESIPAGSRMDFGEAVRIPLRAQSKHIITFFGPKAQPFKPFSYYEILKDKVQAELDGKIFIVGSSAPGLFDIKAVPHDRAYPAVEIHASLINSFLTNTFIRRLEPWQDFIILLLIGIIIGVISFMLKPLPGAILTLLSIFIYFLFAMTLFGADRIWIEIARPILTIFFTFAAIMAYRYITEEKDRKFLHNTFKQYLSPDLIDIMYKNKQQPMLGGEEGVLTAFFTDIQSFSTFSEKLGSPTRLVELLNEYLSEMTDTLLKHYGTLDKYEGDAIIAFFGAPMHMDDHAYQACCTALDMQSKLGDLRKKWTSEGDKWPAVVHQMRMRIGINTGLITTGNMGSGIRKNYTMMGDAVNLAARLESAAKQYGVYTMISGKTYELVKDDFYVRQIDKITVVGKSEPVVVFELLAHKGKVSSEIEKMVGLYQQGVDYFYAREWDRAIAILQEAHLLEPYKDVAPHGMTPSRKIIEYCETYKITPPGNNWDGVMSLTSK